MGARQVFDALQQAGLTITLLGDGTLWASPKTAITDDARAMIRANKTALVELLSNGGGDPSTTQEGSAEPHTTATTAVPEPLDSSLAGTQGAIGGGGLPMPWLDGMTQQGTAHAEDFEERAAIIEHDGAIPKPWAEGLAMLCTMRRPDDFTPQRWRALVNAAATFSDRWATKAHQLGWTVGEVFGCHRIGPTVRYAEAGLLMSMTDKAALIELTPDLAIFEVGKGRHRQTLHRNMIFAQEQSLLWNLK